jgi:anti-anti-sigma factor
LGPFELLVSSVQGHLGVQLEGEVDMDSSEQLLDSLLCASTAHGPCNVVVDLRDVTFMDSSGIQALVRADQALRDDGSHLVLCGPSRMVRRLLELCGVGDYLDVRPAWAAIALLVPGLASTNYQDTTNTASP